MITAPALAWTELLLSIGGIVVWAVVMFRGRREIRDRVRAEGARVALFLVTIWLTLGSFLARALYDLGWADTTVAGIAGGVVRGIFLMIGLVLLTLGPVTLGLKDRSEKR